MPDLALHERAVGEDIGQHVAAFLAADDAEPVIGGPREGACAIPGKLVDDRRHGRAARQDDRAGYALTKVRDALPAIQRAPSGG